MFRSNKVSNIEESIILEMLYQLLVSVPYVAKTKCEYFSPLKRIVGYAAEKLNQENCIIQIKS